MADDITQKVRSRLDRQKTAIGMVFVGVVAAAALLKQKQARRAANRPRS